MKLKHKLKLTLELKKGEIILTEMKIIETFTNTNKYSNESEPCKCEKAQAILP